MPHGRLEKPFWDCECPRQRGYRNRPQVCFTYNKLSAGVQLVSSKFFIRLYNCLVGMRSHKVKNPFVHSVAKWFIFFALYMVAVIGKQIIMTIWAQTCRYKLWRIFATRHVTQHNYNNQSTSAYINTVTSHMHCTNWNYSVRMSVWPTKPSSVSYEH